MTISRTLPLMYERKYTQLCAKLAATNLCNAPLANAPVFSEILVTPCCTLLRDYSHTPISQDMGLLGVSTSRDWVRYPFP